MSEGYVVAYVGLTVIFCVATLIVALSRYDNSYGEKSTIPLWRTLLPLGIWLAPAAVQVWVAMVLA